MPYKDIEQRREAVRRHRGFHKGISGLHSIVYALADPVKREKLGQICLSLKSRGLLGQVYYGISGMTFEQVAELVDCFADKIEAKVIPSGYIA